MEQKKIMLKPEYRIFITICCSYIISGMFSTLTSTLAAYFAGDVRMTPGIMGIFFSMGGVLTALAFTLPGRAVDKIGAKKAIIILLIGELTAVGLFGFARSSVGCMIFLSIHSLVTSMSVPINTQVLRAYKVENPSKLLRVNLVGSMVSGMVAAAIAAPLIEKSGLTWRQTFGVFFVISAVIAAIGLVFLFSVKGEVKGYAAVNSKGKNDTNPAKSYQYTSAEQRSCIALCLLYIGYMGVGIALSTWMPAYLQGKGFTGVQVSLPNTVGKFAQLMAYLVLPTIFAKMLKSSKVTPLAALLLIASVFGIMLPSSLTIISIARGLLAVVMGFLSMHVQSDITIVAPAQASGRFSSTVLACANAGGVFAVIMMGYLSESLKLAMLITFAMVAVIGALMFIKPCGEIKALKEVD